MRLGRRAGMPPHRFAVRLFHPRKPIALSDILPLAENLGLRVLSEAPFLLQAPGKEGVALQVLRVETADKSPVDLAEVGPRFAEALDQLWAGALENDGLNRLVLGAGLAWREVAVLRAYAKYLRQTGIAFSQDYMERALVAYPAIARGTVDLFMARFDPALGEAQSAERADAPRSDRDDDRRRAGGRGDARRGPHPAPLPQCRALQPAHQLLQRADGKRSWISFKVDSRAIDELPAPRPLVEIFVYSPRMEGIHLRGGRVARGGIRWSDRREDFRTEILGPDEDADGEERGDRADRLEGRLLREAPAGRRHARAGPGRGHRLLPDPDPRPARHHRQLRRAAACVPPANVVRHDGDDPYLVVAADKGTATFSDIANALARDYGFWLDDAFASGGSAGYDHKKMGITARGAWESVKRHFRELGHRHPDARRSPSSASATCRATCSATACCCRSRPSCWRPSTIATSSSIPTPDPATSWAERKRLFDLPRSSWMDYDKKLISPGGGVYDRTAKSIALSAEAQHGAGHRRSRPLTPVDLMRAILKAPVDLLYFGGIGTYVKASSESQRRRRRPRQRRAARRRADSCARKVIGEGANLGFTQRGRVEAALGGRKINTDALDNSAGVDTSDHEVNIKIAIGEAIARGGSAAATATRCCSRMTDEVAALVLRHNYQQSQAISVAEAQAAEEHDRLERFMRALERQGRLDRAVEFLPDTAAMRARGAGHGSISRGPSSRCCWPTPRSISPTRSSTPTCPTIRCSRASCCATSRRRCSRSSSRSSARHRLRREIATLQVVNSLVNRCGPTFVRTVGQRTGAPAAAIARAFAVVRDAWKLRDLWGEIEALDPALKAEAQTRMLVASQRFLTARRAMDAAPPAAAARHHGRDRAARRRRGGAGRSAVLR